MKMTIGQVLTMASIVEGETVLDRERPIIADYTTTAFTGE